MKVTQILSAGFGVAVVCFAGVLFLGTRGASNSLRGGSPTKSLGARAAARRALLKTLVYGTKKTNSRRLQNTFVSCDKVGTITQDALACVYPSNPAGQTGTQSHCLSQALVSDGLFASTSPVVSLLERSSEILDADAVSYPYGDAVSLATVMTSLCTAAPSSGPGSNGRGLSSLTQDNYVNQVTSHFNENVVAMCQQHVSPHDEYECNDFAAVLEAGLTLADLGN
jgi:hypothetical protein